MFVPILTDMFNHWIAQGAIPGSVYLSVLILPDFLTALEMDSIETGFDLK